MTVLIVEDDAPIRELLVDVLEDEGYPVQSAANGKEAFSVLRSLPQPPKLILLDLMMPVMDGWAFRYQQLQEPQVSDIPVIVLSAAYELHRQATIIKAASYLTKPVDITELLATVARYYA